MTDTLWPHPPRRPGSRIRHGWRCSRRGKIEKATRRDTTGAIREVQRCTECGHDDYAERILGDPPPKDAA